MRAASSWFPWPPSKDLQPGAPGANKDLLFVIRDLTSPSMGSRLGAQITSERRMSHS